MANKSSFALYSFRRCPYAIRARMALALTFLNVDLIEVKLSNKPIDLLNLSPKGTVPVLYWVEENCVIDESIDIMSFAHQKIEPPLYWDPDHLLINLNDIEFKPLLDKYKYFERYPEKTQQEHREATYGFLQILENMLCKHVYLLSDDFNLIDVAIMPFIRQFALTDNAWWHEQILFPKLKIWLNNLTHSELFGQIMQKNLTKIPRIC